MPLQFTGAQRVVTPLDMEVEAYDGPTRVVVVATNEAITKRGLSWIRERASFKYDAGQLDRAGRVQVDLRDS
jgi:hypothetical protein